MAVERVLSGMRPTGNLHLGHYNGVPKPIAGAATKGLA